MRRQAWLSSLIIAGPPTGLTVLFAMTAARQLQPDLTVIAVVAYLGALSVSIHAWLRLQEQRGLEQQSKLSQEEHHLAMQLRNLERDQRSQSRDEKGRPISHTSEDLAPILTLRRKENAEGG
jgi:hypothetical protein